MPPTTPPSATPADVRGALLADLRAQGRALLGVAVHVLTRRALVLGVLALLVIGAAVGGVVGGALAHRAPVVVVTHLTHEDSIAIRTAYTARDLANARSAELSRQLGIARKEAAVQRIEYTPLRDSALALAKRVAHKAPTGARDTLTTAAASTSSRAPGAVPGVPSGEDLARACEDAIAAADQTIAKYVQADSLAQAQHLADGDALAAQAHADSLALSTHLRVDSLAIAGLRQQLATATRPPSRLERAWGKVRTPLAFLAGLYVGAKAGVAIQRAVAG